MPAMCSSIHAIATPSLLVLLRQKLKTHLYYERNYNVGASQRPSFVNQTHTAAARFNASAGPTIAKYNFAAIGSIIAWASCSFLSRSFTDVVFLFSASQVEVVLKVVRMVFLSSSDPSSSSSPNLRFHTYIQMYLACDNWI